MSSRSSWIWIGVGLLALVIAAIAGRDVLWSWLLALHGRH
jgi:hypothetical protein